MGKQLRLVIHGKQYEMEEPMSLLKYMQKMGISGVYAACNGQGNCGKCKVIVREAGSKENRVVQACQYVPKEDVQIHWIEKASSVVAKGIQDKNADLKEQTIQILGIDIGTTNVCYQSIDTDGNVCKEEMIANPQGVYGADVMHRIQAANEGRLHQMHQMIVELIDSVASNLASQDTKIVISANTTMRYLLEGRNPQKLGVAPYVAEDIHWGKVQIGDYKCDIISGISAFVGGDIVSGIYALKMLEKNKTTLLLDLGTNGEMALAYEGHLYCSSAPAGPAFETREREYGSHLIQECSCLLEAGEMDETGNLLNMDGQEELQQNIRTLQLGKSAIRAGAESLLHEAKITWQEVDEIYLAGNFGKNVSSQDLCKIGLLPIEVEKRIQVVGNVSLAGAIRLGKHPTEKEVIDEIVKHASTLSLADTTYFGEKFLEYMFF